MFDEYFVSSEGGKCFIDNLWKNRCTATTSGNGFGKSLLFGLASGGGVFVQPFLSTQLFDLETDF